MSNNEYSVVDLFSGAGGFSLGFDQPERLEGLGNLDYSEIGFNSGGFSTDLAIDNYEEATETFSKNFDCPVICADVENIQAYPGWGNTDVVIGGPPCQGFSNLNSVKTEKLSDDRNGLWEVFLEAVDEIRPKVFVIENVSRFLRSAEGLAAVEKAEELGYNTIVDVLNAANYGVPQRRERGFIIGSRIGTPFLPAATDQETRTVRDAIGDLPQKPTDENLHETRNFSKLQRDRMRYVAEGENRYQIPRYLLPDCWKDYEGSGTDLFGRLEWSEPSVTIRTSFHKPMKGRHLYPESFVPRTLTLREGARLQTFPDNFEFGTNYQVHRARLIGNAVPPKLAYHIALAVKSHLDGLEGQKKKDENLPHEKFTTAKREPTDVLEDYR
ncbi:DNA (cytosine-5)-methyltransferase 1 [Natronoarchaeum philippinense]|uniref:DNA (cytosine-5-)-methyltransferase n=1 Tax=Natronoarchaeum philippinense TaxID=558529 RepID=A0A285NT62_NATPI|nr:DNA cytosine methyltransferase [Natronoarchaeum philippinense]SNZ12113.1 DNA (cytosine-5)-methyltransferase 1 [Natronoarchaeum philippinense]